MDELDNFISVRKCASILNVHYDTIRRAIHSGKLKAYRVGQRKLRIKESYFLEYINSLKIN
jgi:excisionase family DNA binding protein